MCSNCHAAVMCNSFSFHAASVLDSAEWRTAVLPCPAIHRFIIGLGIAIGFAAAVPKLGATGGYIRAEYSIKLPAIIIIFIISGLGLKTKALLTAVGDLRIHFLVQVGHLCRPRRVHMVLNGPVAVSSWDLRMHFLVLVGHMCGQGVIPTGMPLVVLLICAAGESWGVRFLSVPWSDAGSTQQHQLNLGGLRHGQLCSTCCADDVAGLEPGSHPSNRVWNRPGLKAQQL